MATIIFGNQNVLIKKVIKKTVEDFFGKGNEKNLSTFDSHEINEDELIEECNQYSLMFEKKMIIVNDCTFLTATREDKNKFEYSNKLLKYLEDENKNTELVFTICYDKQLDSKNKIVKYIKEHGNIKECLEVSPTDWPKQVRKYFEANNILIDDDACDEFSKRTLCNFSAFTNEKNKLLLYKSNNITLEDVKKIVTQPLEDNIFDILNCALLNKKDKAVKIYKDLLNNKVYPIEILNAMTSSLMTIDQVLYLYRNRTNIKEIATKVGRPYFVISNIINDFKKLSDKNISEIINKLHKVDIESKLSQVDSAYGLELFIISI